MVNLVHVEAVACRLSFVADAAAKVVLVQESPEIALFCVGTQSYEAEADDNRISADGLASNIKKSIQTMLPTYAVPRFIEEIDTIPRTLSGKVDRMKLPELSKFAASGVHIDRTALPHAAGLALTLQLTSEQALALRPFDSLLDLVPCNDDVAFAGVDGRAPLTYQVSLVSIYVL